MALKSTIFKAEIQVADMDRHHYQTHALTIARHPSENDERMMVRLAAFALYAEDELRFANGLSINEEPDLWRKDLTGAIESWIDVGLPDARLLRKAAGRARSVVVFTYGGRAAVMWWEQNRTELQRLANLTVIDLPVEATRALALLARRTMQLQCTVQEGQVWIGDGDDSVHFEPVRLLGA